MRAKISEICNIRKIYLKTFHNKYWLPVPNKTKALLKRFIDYNDETALQEYNEINNIISDNLIEKYGTPIHTAIIHNDEGAFLTLLANRFYNVNSPNVNGDTPLHMCVIYGRNKMLNHLIAMGALLNIKNNMGKLPIDLVYDCYGKVHNEEIYRTLCFFMENQKQFTSKL